MNFKIELHVPDDPKEIETFVDEVNSSSPAEITLGEPELQIWETADDEMREQGRNSLREEIISQIAEHQVGAFIITAEDGTILSLAKHKHENDWQILDVDGELRKFMEN